MAKLYDISTHMKEHIKKEQFDLALSLFRSHYRNDFTKEEVANNEYVVSDLLKCLRKTHQHDKGYELLKHLGIRIDPTTPKRILESYGWLLFDKLKNQSNNEEADNEEYDIFKDAEDETAIVGLPIYQAPKDELLDRIYNLLPILDYTSQYSPFSKLFNLVLKTENKKPNSNWKYVDLICKSVDYNKLNTECESFEAEIKGRIKTIEIASDKEVWFAFQSKALLKLGQFQECFDISQLALEQIDKFHYNNNIWFARRIALTKKHLGDSASAIKELEKILLRKQDWFIQAELGELYLEINKIDKALELFVRAALNHGDAEYKIGVFLNIGKLLKQKEDNKTAFEHFLLVKLIREEHQWRVPQQIDELIKSTKPETVPDYKNSKELINHLKNFWTTLIPQPIVNNLDKNKRYLLKGFISNIRLDKGFGFIKGEDKIDYFFKLDDFKEDKTKLINGLKVSYESKSPKEQGKNPQAIKIKIS